MIRRLVCGVLLFLPPFGTLTSPQAAQRGGPPRRIPNPETILLAGGSRVEFREFSSQALGREIRYSIFVPPSYRRQPRRKFPVIYFLHGMFNDDTSWCVDRYGNLPLAIERMVLEGKVPEFLMVHPQGENSFYTDLADGSQKFEEYIRRDLIEEVERSFRVRRRRSARAIGGTSMGGYGALKIAIKYPQLYASAAAGSPIVLLGNDPTVHWAESSSRRGRFFSELFANVFGDPIDREHWKNNSLGELARKAVVGDLRILLIYGTADRYNGLIPMEKGIRTLKKILSERGVAVQLEILENEPHGWNLVAGHLQETVEFLTRTF